MTIRLKTAMLAATALLALAGCGGGGGGDGGISGTGIMQLAITDAPSCGYDHVYLTVDRVRVHKSSTAVDGDTGWSEVVLTPARRIDLLTLTNGVLNDLGQTPLPAGKYTQMRLVLAPNSGSNPPPNAVTPTGGAEVALTTPSAQQSGIKLNVNMDVAAGTLADFVIDFDACKSIVKRGNSGQYNLKPVMAVIPVVSNAGMRVVGYVDPSIAVATTNVSVQINGVPVKATMPNTGLTDIGKFELYPVPVGTYDLVVTAAGHVTAVMTGVPVVSSSITSINSATTRIVTPSATMRSVNGTVNPATTTVRALQMLTGGPTVEVAWGLVDDLVSPATFSFSLPIEAPIKAAYVANPVAMNFVIDTPAIAGHYTLEASSGGVVKTQAIDANASVPAVAFTFP
jgi:hypothetical protein